MIPTYTLNIGLARQGKPNLTRSEVISALCDQGLLQAGNTSVLFSDTEPMLAIPVRTSIFTQGPLNEAVHRAAVALDQEAIAVWCPSLKTGALFGPKSLERGPFDPAGFLLTNGQRLADTLN